MKHCTQDVMLSRATCEPERERAPIGRQLQICIKRVGMHHRQVCRIVFYRQHNRASHHHLLSIFRQSSGLERSVKVRARKGGGGQKGSAMVHRVMPMVKNATGAAAAAAGCGALCVVALGKSGPINAVDGAQLKHPKSESNHRVPPVFTPLSIKNIWNASIRQ